MSTRIANHKNCWNKILILCCLPVCVHATQNIEIPTDKDWSVTLVHELEILPDEDNVWTPDIISKSTSSIFQPNTNVKRPTLFTYWARVMLVNPGAMDEFLSVESNYWDYVTLYLMDSTGQQQILHLGILNGKSNSSFVVQKKSAVTILAKFESSGQFRRELNINLVLSKTIPKLEEGSLRNYLDGIIFGIMFGLALYNLFLYLSLRDKTYFWYTLYVFLFAATYITLFVSTPSNLVQFFMPDQPGIAFYIKKLGDPVLWMVFIQFTRSFLQIKSRLPVWDGILKVMMGLILLQLLINFSGLYHFTGPGRTFLWTLSSVVCVLLAIKCYWSGFYNAKFFLFGQILVAFGHVGVFLYYINTDIFWFLPHSPLVDYFRTPNLIFFCGGMEAVFFSFALASKYNRIQQDLNRVTLENEQEKQNMLAAQNETLETQVTERTVALRQSLDQLKATQAQLIHAEKMASLGELTAGIAHEIQNPLNFITNYSQINVELFEDLKSGESKLLNGQDHLMQTHVFRNLYSNSEKINHHGKRVDAIVKGMLQHARKSSIVKEFIDINALCDECMKLVYHGFRAKENSFTVSFETNFDPDLPKVKVLPQDFGRVILNIITNAFYAVHDKRKNLLADYSDDYALVTDTYQPKVVVTTKQIGQWISIIISDNGQGIPANNLEKIFQPFFTTKPAGDGTGLGLSLAYDIVTNGHSGELKVISREGIETQFEIKIPIGE